MLFNHLSSIQIVPLSIHSHSLFFVFSLHIPLNPPAPKLLSILHFFSLCFNRNNLFTLLCVNVLTPACSCISHHTCFLFIIFSQNPLHFQMAMQTIEAPPSRLLYSLLMMNGWWDISVLLCQEWDISDFLLLIKNNTRFHLGNLVNLTTTASASMSSPSSLSHSGVASGVASGMEASSALSSLPYFPPAASSPTSSATSSSKSDQQQALMRQLEALREPSTTTGVVTFGCEIREVRRLWTLATRMTLPEFHWVLGDSQNVAELRTEGLPLGLLAHGVMGSPSLDHYVHDSVELVARAVGTAAQDNPALALIPGTTNCMDVQQSNGSSGEYLAR